jgi:excisionase family DNA binding protein
MTHDEKQHGSSKARTLSGGRAQRNRGGGLAPGALPELLSPDELSMYLGIPLATVYGWRTRGEGPPGVRIGRHVRYRAEDVLGWLDGLGAHQ